MSTGSSLVVDISCRLPAFTLDISFHAFNGGSGIAALLGPSGAGKSLTLRAIAGLVRPDRGRIAFGPRVLFARDAGGDRPIDVPARDRSVGYMFQQYALFPHLTVGGNIAFGLSSMPSAERVRVVTEMLELVGLSDFADRRPHTLSGGQQQRVALARAIAPRPSLLLLDEPLAALDVPLRRQLGDELRALHARTGVPMLLVTHDPQEAERIAGEILRIERGKCVL